MYSNRKNLLIAFAVTCTMMVGRDALAVFTQVLHQDDPAHCDPLAIPLDVDEIGDFLVFPPDEALDHFPLTVVPPVCPPFDNPQIPDLLVGMTNLTGRSFREVWYVANPNTSISNYDGFANDAAFPGGHEAFRIDRLISDPLGSHHPLVFEDMTPDGIWEPGEVWHFVLQDFMNAFGLGPDLFTSIGVGDASIPAGIIDSSGSIIAIAVPEPAAAVLALLGALGFVVARRACRKK